MRSIASGKEKAICPFWKGRNGRLSHRYTGYKTHQYQTQSDLPILKRHTLSGPQCPYSSVWSLQDHKAPIPVNKFTYPLWIQYPYPKRPADYGYNTRIQDDLQVMDTIPVLKTNYKLWIQVINTTYPLWI